jgi:hypothetical protein
VALERHPDAVDDVSGVHRRQPDVPLETVEERRVRQVRGADECRREAGIALQQPCLRVELGRASVERDAELRTERNELIDGPFLCRAHVGRCDDTDASSARLDPSQRLPEVPNARPDHEGTDQIDRVGGGQLGAQFRADIGLPLGVDE